MINQLKIENFRGIDNVEINDMKRICLISGKNNVGKSTILEALFLLIDHMASNSFIKLNNFRGKSGVSQTDLWAPLFNNLDTDKVINLSIKQEDVESTLKYMKDTNYLPQSQSGIPEDVLAQFKSFAKESYSLMFEYSEGGYKESGHFFSAETNGILRQVSTNKADNELKPMIRVQFVNSILSRSMDMVIDGIGKMELDGKKSEVIDILKEIDPAIEDIVTISRQNVSQLHVRVKGKWIPLEFAGDGVMKLLHICMAIWERKNSLILIDEIETGFHYSMYGSLWRIVNKISKEANCQVIATTHSYEMISALKENAVDTNEL